jgi:tRNA threonylcarbamoyladenosine biosynthesis protein TsaB
VKVLAIETATTVCAAALVVDGRVVSEASVCERYVHAEKLMQQVDAVLREGNCSLFQLDGVAVSIGPGSFTGLRIGLSVAKGLSYAAEKKLVAVPTLHALSRRAVDEGIVRDGEYVLAVIDARRDEVYGQLFHVLDGRMELQDEPRDVPVGDLRAEIPLTNTWLTGDASSKVQSVAADLPQLSVVPEGFGRCSAGSVGRVGEMLLTGGIEADVATLEPFYIKEVYFKQRP